MRPTIHLRLSDATLLFAEVAKRRDPAWGASKDEAERGALAMLFPEIEVPEGEFGIEIIGAGRQ